jgi:hypothetical protein
MSTLAVRKLAGLLSLLMILLGGPASGAFALCFNSNGHLAIEVGNHDHGSAPGLANGLSAEHHLNAAVDCIDIPLVQSAPPILKKQTVLSSDAALPAASVPWALSPKGQATVVAAFPSERPSLDPRLVSHRTVVLLN